MSRYLGDFGADQIVRVYFSTNAADGGRESPSDAFEVADFRVYKNGVATARSSQAGWAYDNEVDAMVGVHCLSIDLSDDTDAGFYAAGGEYAVVLYPDETVDSQNIAAILAQFSIERTNGALARLKAAMDNIDTTGGSLTLAKAIEAIVACLLGKAAHTASTGVTSFKGRDGETEIVETTSTGGGSRTGSTIS